MCLQCVARRKKCELPNLDFIFFFTRVTIILFAHMTIVGRTDQSRVKVHAFAAAAVLQGTHSNGCRFSITFQYPCVLLGVCLGVFSVLFVFAKMRDPPLEVEPRPQLSRRVSQCMSIYLSTAHFPIFLFSGFIVFTYCIVLITRTHST